MREFCLTEEVLQQFVDGELSPEQTETTATHVAACQPCALLLGEVEQENAVLMEALAPELSLPVPTVRLRERLDAAVAALEPRPRQLMSESAGSRIRALFDSLFGSLSFTPQRAFGFASLAVVVVFAAIFVVIQLRHGKETRQAVALNKDEQRVVPATPEATARKDNPDAPVVATLTPEIKNDGYNQSPRRAAVKRTAKTIAEPATPVTPPVVEPKLLPGEKSYLEAIASLTTAIETSKDEVFKPTVRADYERNLAVVDQAIATTRQQAKRNPGDRDAVEFMYTAYQNKIELLSAVADQTRIASR